MRNGHVSSSGMSPCSTRSSSALRRRLRAINCARFSLVLSLIAMSVWRGRAEAPPLVTSAVRVDADERDVLALERTRPVRAGRERLVQWASVRHRARVLEAERVQHEVASAVELLDAATVALLRPADRLGGHLGRRLAVAQ